MKRPQGGFDVFVNRIVISGELTTKTGLHIGTSANSAATGVDKVMLRNRFGEPFIPGASFKGVVRAAAASVLRGFTHAGAPDDAPCHEWACADDLDADARCFDRKNKKLGTDPTPTEVEEKAFTWTCPTCRVFGSPYFGAKVRFTDAALLNSSTWFGFEVRDGVGISRDTRTAAPGIKYDFEAVPPGTTFGLEIALENAELAEIGLALMGFDLLDQGVVRLGGIKSRGLGRVAITWTAIEEWGPRDALKGQPAKRIDRHINNWEAEIKKWLTAARDALERAVGGGEDATHV